MKIPMMYRNFLMGFSVLVAGSMSVGGSANPQDAALHGALEAAERELVDAFADEQKAEAAIDKTYGLRTGAAQENLKNARDRVQKASEIYDNLQNQEIPGALGDVVRSASRLITVAAQAESTIDIAQNKRSVFAKSWNYLADEKPVLAAEARAAKASEETKGALNAFNAALAKAGVKPETIDQSTPQGIKIAVAAAAAEKIRNQIATLGYSKAEDERARANA